MGYWIRGHEGERNNCFTKIQPVGQKYRDKTTLASKKRFSRHCFGFQSRRFSLLVGHNIWPSIEEGSKLTYDRLRFFFLPLLWLRTLACLLLLFQDLFQMNCYVCYEKWSLSSLCYRSKCALSMNNLLASRNCDFT